MRNVLSGRSFVGAIVALAVVAALSAGQAAQPAHVPVDSQDRGGFGDAITFTASGYTPPGIVNLVRQPLASLNQAGFGDAITFTASGYTPPGITNHSTIEVVVAR